MNQFKQNRRKRLITIISLMAAALAIGAFLRFYGLTNAGFRNCDEGYYFYPGKFMEIYRNPEPFLYYYHGTIAWVKLGCSMLGFTPEAALIWAALNGLAAVLALFVFVKRLAGTKTALLAAVAVTFNYYAVYYSRCNLSNIYGAFFVLVALCPLAQFAVAITQTLTRGELPKYNNRHMCFNIILTGLVAGLLFHVRVSSFLFLTGMGCALFITALCRAGKEKCPGLALIMASYGVLFIISTVFSYAAFIIAIEPWVDWPQTIVWYKRQLPFLTGGTSKGWAPYLTEHLWRLCGAPFLAIAAIGVISETRCIKAIPMPRLWLLICLWGSIIGLLTLGIPFPRAHLMPVILLCIYWALGVKMLAGKVKKYKSVFLSIIIAATFAGEAWLAWPMMNKRTGYAQTAALISAKPANCLYNRNWPILLSYNEELQFVPLDVMLDNQKGQASLEDVLANPKATGNCRYLIIDYYTSAFMSPSQLKRLSAATSPKAVFQNDFGNDYHNLMDMFGKIPNPTVFDRTIIVYDLKNKSAPPIDKNTAK